MIIVAGKFYIIYDYFDYFSRVLPLFELVSSTLIRMPLAFFAGCDACMLRTYRRDFFLSSRAACRGIWAALIAFGLPTLRVHTASWWLPQHILGPLPQAPAMARLEAMAPTLFSIFALGERWIAAGDELLRATVTLFISRRYRINCSLRHAKCHRWCETLTFHSFAWIQCYRGMSFCQCRATTIR